MSCGYFLFQRNQQNWIHAESIIDCQVTSILFSPCPTILHLRLFNHKYDKKITQKAEIIHLYFVLSAINQTVIQTKFVELSSVYYYNIMKQKELYL